MKLIKIYVVNLLTNNIIAKSTIKSSINFFILIKNLNLAVFLSWEFKLLKKINTTKLMSFF